MRKDEGVHESKMLDEIETLGYTRPSIDLLHKTSTPLPPDVVSVILKWLPKIYKDHIGSAEHLIRALITTEEPFNPSVIIDLFENSDYNSTLKWTMAYVISISKVTDISDYIRDQLFNKPAAFERAGFLAAIDKNANFKSRQELMDALKKIFDKESYFWEVFFLYRKYGRIEDIPFLEERRTTYDKKKAKELDKVINGIYNRKREHSFPLVDRTKRRK
jgi:hypothetical protein